MSLATMPLPSPEQLIARLADQIAPTLGPESTQISALVGIHTGGVWVMDALLARLGHRVGNNVPRGVLDISFYRDDFSRIGLHPQVKPSDIPFDMEGRRVLLIDDVLHTGRTIRAAMNVLFDYGRPAAIRLAVLLDRGGRELPVCADFVGANLELAAQENIALTRAADGALGFKVEKRP
jgi:pyrimidine operon attenuation protein / uracil phosphoribosyltransferase